METSLQNITYDNIENFSEIHKKKLKEINYEINILKMKFLEKKFLTIPIYNFKKLKEIYKEIKDILFYLNEKNIENKKIKKFINFYFSDNFSDEEKIEVIDNSVLNYLIIYFIKMLEFKTISLTIKKNIIKLFCELEIFKTKYKSDEIYKKIPLIENNDYFQIYFENYIKEIKGKIYYDEEYILLKTTFLELIENRTLLLTFDFDFSKIENLKKILSIKYEDENYPEIYSGIKQIKKDYSKKVNDTFNNINEKIKLFNSYLDEFYLKYNEILKKL